MINPADIMEHMEVVGSDGEHIGTVDHLAIKLTKTDPDADGVHHLIPMEFVESIDDDKLVLNITASEARDEEDEIED